MTEEPLFEPTFEEHRLAQQKRFARDTTPAQRLEWLEQALKFAHAAGIDYAAQKRRLRGIADDAIGH